MILNHRFAACMTCAVTMAFAGCSNTQEKMDAAAAPKPWQSEFTLERSELASRGSSPYFILEPGYRLTYRGREDGKDVDLVITVLDQTESVDGVETRVVEERESQGGELVEVSRNFFAISTRTHDVYYFGEDVDMYEHGEIESHEGAWRSGVHGAHFGLMMPGVPVVGMRYQSETAPHVAMDRCEVVSMDTSVTTPAGRFEHCVRVEETTPIEAGSKEYKLYARGIGLVQDSTLLLTSHGTAR